MKKITAYMSTVRVHWLVEELAHLGVDEIMVTEFFRPTSQISRLELCCDENLVDQVRDTIHRVGTTGDVPDHDVIVSDYDPTLPSQIPLGKRISRLQESRIKQLVNMLLKGLTGKLSTAFFVITICIFAVGIFVHTRIGTFQEYLEKRSKSTRVMSETVHQIQRSLLSEMLAAERLHRGEVEPAVKDFQVARSDLKEAIEELKEGNNSSPSDLDSIVAVERRFQSVVGGMITVIGQLSTSRPDVSRAKASALKTTHQEIMNSLERDRSQLLELLQGLEKKMSERGAALENDVAGAITDVQVSLTALAALAGLITLAMWLVAEREVARPLQVLVKEAKSIDTGELR